MSMLYLLSVLLFIYVRVCSIYLFSNELTTLIDNLYFKHLYGFESVNSLLSDNLN